MLHLKGVDLLDGTPVLDIKPYLSYVDAIPDAQGGFAPYAPEKKLSVQLSERARQECDALQKSYPELEGLIINLLELDPRPAYRDKNKHQTEYGMSLYDLNIRWVVNEQNVQVLSITPT